MTAVTIFLDESGDLGWTFSAPYRKGGSSRFLTLGALLVPSEKTHLPRRFIKGLYKRRSWTTPEKKWTDMGPGARHDFAESALQFRKKNPDVFYCSIVVKKEKVAAHIRDDGNKLYNYMVRCLLLDKMSAYDEARLIPDPRSIKVKSGNSMHDYLQTLLWFDKGVKTKLTTTPLDSESCLGLHFADMLTGLVFCHHEDGDSDCWKVLGPEITAKTLFF